MNGDDFKAKVSGIYDGDTLTGIIEIFPGRFCQLKFRLRGIDTPELYGNEREKARLAMYRVVEIVTGAKQDHLSPKEIKSLLNGGGEFYVYVKCSKFEKYGRVLADVFAESAYEDGESINDILLAEGLAVPYMT
jgi:micrococcal nuclease